MTKLWLWWWFLFFRSNPDYKGYCAAKRANDVTVCASMETAFALIATLYEDWGDIHAFRPTSISDESWKEWLNPRQRLFLRPKPIKLVVDPANYVKYRGHVLLDVTLSKKKSEVLRHIDEFLTPYYTDREVVTPKPPKYELHAPKGRIDKTMLERAQKAYYVNMHRRLHIESKPLSIADTAIVMVKDGDEGLDWQIDPATKAEILEGSVSKVLMGSEITRLDRYRKDFDAYVRNTIEGRFPDNT